MDSFSRNPSLPRWECGNPQPLSTLLLSQPELKPQNCVTFCWNRGEKKKKGLFLQPRGADSAQPRV